MLRRRLVLGAALAPFAAARAESWPAKPIRVILPGPVGGLIDVAGRAIGDAMQKELGQPWLIDPRPGGNGIVAAQMFLGAPADGYTLYLTVSGHVALPFLMKVPFDAMADFRPIAMIGASTALLCVPPESPANTVAEFVAYARANPGKLNYLNSGNGTGTHLLPELLKIKYGLDITSISYKGLPPGVHDLLAGRLDLAMVSTTLVMQHVKAGRLKAIALVGPRRLAELPDVATMAEQGAGDTEVRSMLPLYGQRTLPDAILDRISKAMLAAQADPETKLRLAAAYIEPMPLSPAETEATLKAEHERLGKLIQQLGIKADGA
ncbi:MAG: tripartite tricarboxylate transporter substrate binding protein [Reyranella sp.]|nr:tripartite tricarboxylate transporter substrate binding protein [Reyranella sp.]MBL6650992.1 tripartite tricarboxylate transporter substrate binding protein [Reyranella sp.]